MIGVVTPGLSRRGETVRHPPGRVVSWLLRPPARLNETNDRMCRHQAHEREDEDEPARERVEESLGVLETEPLADEAGDHDPARVSDDGDRDYGSHEHRHCPDPREG